MQFMYIVIDLRYKQNFILHFGHKNHNIYKNNFQRKVLSFIIHLKTCNLPFFYMLVCHSLMAFNIDPVTWKTFTSNENTAFGYKVLQKGARWAHSTLTQITQNKQLTLRATEYLNPRLVWILKPLIKSPNACNKWMNYSSKMNY